MPVSRVQRNAWIADGAVSPAEDLPTITVPIALTARASEKKKEPIDMTTDEALDYVFAPQIADRLRREVKENDEPEESPEDDLTV